MLRLTGVATGYGDLEVVRDINLEVPAGTFTAVLGRNGIGKTTTLRAIAGLNDLRGGHIELDGQSLDKVPPHKRVALGLSYVQEGKRVFRQRTVEENLLIAALPAKLAKPEFVSRRSDIYDMFPILGDRCRAKAGSMSGGQQQMLALAQALITRPKVLLLDEPSGGLAPKVVAEILATVKGLTEQGVAVLLVEQSVNFALAVADTIALMDLGRIVWTGQPDSPGIDQAIHDAYFAVVETGVAAEEEDYETVDDNDVSLSK